MCRLEAIPAGLGNQSCAVKKLCCGQLWCGRPAIRGRRVGRTATEGLLAGRGRPRAAGRQRGSRYP